MIKKIVYLLLSPFSSLWESVYRFRRFLYRHQFFKSHDFAIPIISIGNVTFGGTGKTPFTIWLADYFDNLGKKVMILTRGYKGRLENSRGIISSGTVMGFNPRDFGDEALLLGRNLKNASVVVGKNRGKNLDYYFNQEMPDIVLLDDGHQHLKIKRCFNIVLFDSMMELEKYKVAPLGYLREGMTALEDADVIVLARANQCDPIAKLKLQELVTNYIKPNTLIVEIGYKPTALLSMQNKLIYSLEKETNIKITALSAIASPDSFHKLLTSCGLELVEMITFPDHHYYTIDEILKIKETAQKNGSVIVTTEKDIVKLKRLIDDENILFLKIELFFIKGEDNFKSLMLDKVFYN